VFDITTRNYMIRPWVQTLFITTFGVATFIQQLPLFKIKREIQSRLKSIFTGARSTVIFAHYLVGLLDGEHHADARFPTHLPLWATFNRSEVG